MGIGMNMGMHQCNKCHTGYKEVSNPVLDQTMGSL